MDHSRDTKRILALTEDLLDWFERHQVDDSDAIEAMAAAIAAIVRAIADDAKDAQVGARMVARIIVENVKDLK